MNYDGTFDYVGYTEKDVLSGRGGLANTHRGNILFRRLVDLRKSLHWQLSNQRQKAALVQSIIDAIKNYGGRFLKIARDKQRWEELSDKEAFQKTSQALRERRGQVTRSVLTHARNSKGVNRFTSSIRFSNEPALALAVSDRTRSAQTRHVSTCSTSAMVFANSEQQGESNFEIRKRNGHHPAHFFSDVFEPPQSGMASAAQTLQSHERGQRYSRDGQNSALSVMCTAEVVPPSLFYAHASAIFPRELDAFLMCSDIGDSTCYHCDDSKQVFPL